jgi:hypothetical protein
MGYQKRTRWGLARDPRVYAEIWPSYTDMDGNPIKGPDGEETGWGWKTLRPLPFRSGGNRTRDGAMKEAEDAVRELCPEAYG